LPSTFLLVLLDQRFAIDPCLPSLVTFVMRVTVLESRTPHQPESFPSHTLGALAFAGRMLPDATLRGMRRSRSHGGIAPTVAGWSLLSEASSPSSLTPCQGQDAGRGADTPASSSFRVRTATARTAPACDRPLAPRYGSDLLTLRLRSLCSWVMVFCTTAPIEEVLRNLPVPLAPRISASLARPVRFYRSRPFGGGFLCISRRDAPLRSGLRSSSHYPLGNCVRQPV